MTEAQLGHLERRVASLIEQAENAAHHIRQTERGSVTHALAHASLARTLDRLRDVRAEIHSMTESRP